jgi:hypothetical protein
MEDISITLKQDIMKFTWELSSLPAYVVWLPFIVQVALVEATWISAHDISCDYIEFHP